MTIPSNCLHSPPNHLFRSPFCQNQSKLTKIAIVAFHILTLGIPLALYHIIASLKGRARVIEKKIEPYPVIGEAAIAFAKGKLKDNPNISEEFLPSKLQPINKDICLLANLETIYFGNFVETLKKHKEDPWHSNEVLHAADSWMKISYAVTCLTLEDLKPFSEQQRKTNREKKTFAQIVIDQTSYQYRTYFFSTNAYHFLRGEVNIVKDYWNPTEEIVGFRDGPISKEHADAFYQKGTLQNSWNILYNDSCDRIKMHITDKIADIRHLNWMKKDFGDETFIQIPDTSPT